MIFLRCTFISLHHQTITIKTNKMETLKNTIGKVVVTIVVAFIAITLIAVSIELFSDLDYLNRLF